LYFIITKNYTNCQRPLRKQIKYLVIKIDSLWLFFDKSLIEFSELQLQLFPKNRIPTKYLLIKYITIKRNALEFEYCHQGKF